MMRWSTGVLGTIAASALAATGLGAQEDSYANPGQIPEVRDFLGSRGFGVEHSDAPAELMDFGRLVGIWDARQEILGSDGAWHEGAPALWIWRFGLGGFVVRDLWLHTVEHLPDYLSALDRPYLLTSMRIYDATAGRWHVAWAANGGGSVPGSSFGTFEATEVDGSVVMLGDSPVGKQRVTFHDVTEASFSWKSEYSTDQGQTWTVVMKVTATKR